MKPIKRFSIRSAFAALVALGLSVHVVAAQGADQVVTLSASELHRLVYSVHLLSQLEEKPELDACLQTMLELGRRNPSVSPETLGGAVAEGLARYRTNVPAHIRVNGGRDEILAAYLAEFGKISSGTNLARAHLKLMESLLLRPSDYLTNLSTADLIMSVTSRSHNQQLLSSQEPDEARRALVDACTVRAWSYPEFGEAMDRFLRPEVLVSITNSPGEILSLTNSALYGDVTLTDLVALSSQNPGGPVSLSSNQVSLLMERQRAAVWGSIGTNLTVLSDVAASQADWLVYLTNQAAIDANAAKIAAARQRYTRQLASSTAAVLVRSTLDQGPAKQLTSKESKLLDAVCKFDGAVFEMIATRGTKGYGSLLTGVLGIGKVAGGVGSSEESVAREIKNTQKLIGDLSTNMNYRFDRVDQSLNLLYETLNDAMGQIANLNESVDKICATLLTTLARLDRMEGNLFTYFTEAERANLTSQMNWALFWNIHNPHGPALTYDQYNDNQGPENCFFTHATTTAHLNTFSPNNFTVDQLSGSAMASQLSSYPLSANLNYLEKVLTNLHQNIGDPKRPVPLSNPEDWSIASYAYLQLAEENPLFFRKKGPQLPTLIARGRELAAFSSNLTFTNGSVNTNLYTALQGQYYSNVANMNTAVATAEQKFAADNKFSLNTWRDWVGNAPRVSSGKTRVLTTPMAKVPAAARDAVSIAAGGQQSLALRAGGGVVGWGNVSVPSNATNIMTIAAGTGHCVALRSNGAVIVWGDNFHGQLNIAASATNVVSVAAGFLHSLALRSNGTVVAWGDNSYGQSTVPVDATNITAVAGGAFHSLALRRDGTVMAWGLNEAGQLNVPAEATNVVAIAAGWGHCLALRQDGSLVAWGNNSSFFAADAGIIRIPSEATNIVAIAAGAFHCLALSADGKVLSWGANDWRQTSVPPMAGSVSKLAGGYYHSVALMSDGSVLAWGQNSSRQCLVPPLLNSQRSFAPYGEHMAVLRPDGSCLDYTMKQTADFGDWPKSNTPPAQASGAVAVAASLYDTLVLKGDGSVFGWGPNYFGQSTIPGTATNVTVLAMGDTHVIALRADGSVVGWGGRTNVPGDLNNVVAIATSSTGGSLALQMDGKIKSWGFYNSNVMANVPDSATNVVAISAGNVYGLALRTDGRVIAWGGVPNGWVGNQCTNVPASATNVVAICAWGACCVAQKADGTLVAWGDNSGQLYEQPEFPANVTNIVALGYRGTALRGDGQVVGLGVGGYNTAISWSPPGLDSLRGIAATGTANYGVLSNATIAAWADGASTTPLDGSSVAAISAAVSGSGSYCGVLRSDGHVVFLGGNSYSEPEKISSASNIVSLAVGRTHILAVRADGTILASGYNNRGQTTVPSEAYNVVDVSVGWWHSLALRADGRVYAWGDNLEGQCNVPGTAVNAVAISAGYFHNLALRADGTVVAWGDNSFGQSTVPASATNVVAISAGLRHSLALRADGTVVGWGDNSLCQREIPPDATNVVAISAGERHSLFLRASDLRGPAASDNSYLLMAKIPRRVGQRFCDVNNYVAGAFGTNLALHDAAAGLSGSKMLISAVLELGMPYTLEQDDVLHGFLYGSESLVDLSNVGASLAAENLRVADRLDSRPRSVIDVAVLRYQRFAERLSLRLRDIQQSGQPEIPRMVGHTLRLLNVMNDAYGSAPVASMEITPGFHSASVRLYGEPYSVHALQECADLNLKNWRSVTNWHDGETLTLPFSASSNRFYRVQLPFP